MKNTTYISLNSSNSFSFLKIYLFIMYTVFSVFCLHVCLQARRGHQNSLQMVVSHHVAAGNWTQHPWKSKQCSEPLSHLSSPCTNIFFAKYDRNAYVNYNPHFCNWLHDKQLTTFLYYPFCISSSLSKFFGRSFPGGEEWSLTLLLLRSLCPLSSWIGWL